MPDEDYWESLFDVPVVLNRLGIDHSLRDVVEIGCGYGTFSLPVAARISGTLATFDIEDGMVERTRSRASDAGVENLTCVKRDVLADGFPFPDASQDACLLFNILHGENPLFLLSEAARVVRPGGVALAIHWRYDPGTPRGPSLDTRPRPEQLLLWAEKTEKLASDSHVIDLPPWHFGLRFHRLA